MPTTLHQLDDIVPPDTDPTQAFLLMQLERIQTLETQFAHISSTLSNLATVQRETLDLLCKSSQENIRFLESTEQGIVSIGKSHISDLIHSASNIHASFYCLLSKSNRH